MSGIAERTCAFFGVMVVHGMAGYHAHVEEVTARVNTAMDRLSAVVPPAWSLDAQREILRRVKANQASVHLPVVDVIDGFRTDIQSGRWRPGA